ncbi:hypothetical protein HDK90DRAFT_259942 [Phyllosticta capitalensis]|uniref:DNA2/NAM7 helicase-like C-terminal domain-containing protein n=1 Tax=Phyllosticta capitalensis TaxID=121624 RepID=A0ABR1YR58_9PEZI
MQLLHLPTLSPTRAHNQTLSSPPHLPDHRRFRFSTNPSSSQVIAAFNGFQGDPEPGLQPAAWTPLLPLPSASQPNRSSARRAGIPTGPKASPSTFPSSLETNRSSPRSPRLPLNPTAIPSSFRLQASQRGNKSIMDVRIKTFDSLQSQEYGFRIVNTVRTDGFGFLAAGNRINVAMSSARFGLLVIMRPDLLQEHKRYRASHPRKMELALKAEVKGCII